MSAVDDLRQRILSNTTPSVTANLLATLRAMPHVKAVRETWFDGWVEIKVILAEWDEDTWHGAHDIIDGFAREYVRSFSVDGHVEIPEPEHSAYRITAEEKAQALEKIRALRQKLGHERSGTA